MVVWASDAEYVLSARQAYELGFQVPTVASPAITMDQVRDLCEPEWVEGWYSVTDFVGNSDDPEVTAFCDKYASDYGEGQKAELYVARRLQHLQARVRRHRACGQRRPSGYP